MHRGWPNNMARVTPLFEARQTSEALWRVVTWKQSMPRRESGTKDSNLHIFMCRTYGRWKKEKCNTEDLLASKGTCQSLPFPCLLHQSRNVYTSWEQNGQKVNNPFLLDFITVITLPPHPRVSPPVRCQGGKHAFCVVCHWANWSLGLMSRRSEHKHSNWEVNWVTGMSTQAKKKHWEGVWWKPGAPLAFLRPWQ